ncbi:MAG TPA: 1-deoxy-D-xylulose-5-phosphate reductoisomerase [Longimicrobiales bacterium]|nr:1-deoxy-D-xylulose-5-phosphate reductoisomerase [Longimicrobiales bacterium]
MKLAILGSTGSIGTSALRVVERHPDRFQVIALAAHSNSERLAEQARRFGASHVAVGDASASAPAAGPGVEWSTGEAAVAALAALPDVDVVLNAVVGAAGLRATLAALAAGKRLALANKESLVAGGPLVMRALREGGGELIPVDSEHSAILQCLRGSAATGAHTHANTHTQTETHTHAHAHTGTGVRYPEVRRLLLTASGGPFREWPAERIASATRADALRHPTWDMGAKITVDSATLVNKALEVIEAHWLFGLGYDAIDVVVHPQSIVHSMVEFVDGSVVSQMGFPTMELPILYALTHPDRLDDGATRFDPVAAGPLTFEAVDHARFPAFGLGVAAGRAGGTATAAFNAANEVAVAAFLADRLSFSGVSETIDAVLQPHQSRAIESLEDVLEADSRAREAARTFIEAC